MSRKNKLFLVSPYVFFLSIVAGVIVSALTIWLLGDQIASAGGAAAYFGDEYWRSIFFLMVICPVIMWITYIVDGYQFLGTWRITEEALVFYAPLRKPRVFRYEEIVDMGIDFGYLSLDRQFWIYFGREKLPRKYANRINRLPMSKKYMRVQYSEKVFNALLQNVPSHMRKRVEGMRSTIRFYKLED